MQPSTIRVLIVDDHFVVRKGIEALLTEYDDIEVVGEACDGRAAVQLTQDLEPDVILMDLLMPEMNGVEATRLIKGSASKCHILILSGYATERETLEAVRAGASGFLSKDCTAEALAEAIHKLYRGELSLPADMLPRLMHHLEKPQASGPALTQREQDVLGLLAQGLDDKEMGRQLGVSKVTVRSHISNLLAKLQLKNRVEAALYALRRDPSLQQDES